MILDNPRRALRRRSLTMSAVCLLAAWSGFVLTGAASAEPGRIVKRKTTSNGQNMESMHTVTLQSADGTKVLIELAPATFTEDGVEGELQNMRFGLQTTQETEDGQATFAFTLEAGDGHLQKVMLHKMMQAEFKALAETHPEADIDGNGHISRKERSALLIALAMLDPEAVLDQFPSADGNEDGELDELEAAKLVDVGMIVHLALTATTNEDADGNVSVFDLGHTIELTPIAIAEDDDAKHERAQFVSPSQWILDNIDVDLSEDEVTYYIPVIEELPLARLLASHPEADLDGDGYLSFEERDEFRATLKKNVKDRFQTINVTSEEGGLFEIIVEPSEGEDDATHNVILQRDGTLFEFKGNLQRVQEDN